MPELPEVETVCRTLSELIVGKTIKEVRVSLPRIIRTPEDPQQFCLELQGETIHDVSRRGKFIKIFLDRIVLISHLRMEGRYGVYDQHDTIEKHTHVFFTFTDGTELRYKDVRQFGTMDLVKRGKEDKSPPLNKLGIEPLDPSFTLDRFRITMNKRTTKIKPLLLNQECIVGLGNIYVDEVLFRSGIHPERREIGRASCRERHDNWI